MTLCEEVFRNFGSRDYYSILGISQDASQNEIKKAYKQKSLELHPDRISECNRRDEFKLKFQTLSEIYKILCDEDQRRHYDEQSHWNNNQETINGGDSTIHEVVPLVSCNELDTLYSYDCRCSGKFILPKINLATQTSSRSAQNHQHVFIVDCDSCSSSIKITVQ